jgi:hypothetical protein
MRENLNLPFEAPSCDMLSPYSSDRKVKEVNTKDVGLKGWISGEVCKASDVGAHNARIE